MTRIVLAIVLLGGCAAPVKTWSKPGATAQAFHADSYECAQQAQRPARASVVIGGGLGPLLADQDDMSKDLYRACLRARGYQRVEGGEFEGLR